MNWLFFIFTRVVYVIWMALCITAAAGLVISLLGYSSVLWFLLSSILTLSLPLTYQFGLDHLDFENAANMFEFENYEEENEEDEKD